MASEEASTIEEAAAALRRGGLVAFPTETVYGLGADAANPDALARLYAVKGRPLAHPVIVHVASAAALHQVGHEVPAVADALATAFWPGPLTLVVHRDPQAVAPQATGGRGTVGVRVPDHPVALALLDRFGAGVAAPSANRFGRVSPTTADHVRADLGTDVDVVLDGGPCRVGVESTIVDCTTSPVAVLRVGGVPVRDLEAVVGAVARRTAGEGGAPGTLAVHYAPEARVEVVSVDGLAARVAEHVAAGRRVGVLTRAPVSPELAGVAGVEVLVAAGSDREYAHELYGALRRADALALPVVVAALPGPDGLGAAVADRLRRAAAASGAASGG
jgi:L-threonylcarbamoyladenylate synthase